MNNKKTPVISIILLIAGVLFLIVAAFMLALAISYTRTYIESYDASFSDMWTNTMQYVIKEFAPYLGIGIICIGAAAAIKEMRNVKTAVQAGAKAAKSAGDEASENAGGRNEEMHAEYIDAIGKLEAGIRNLEGEMNATREILSIKIEEKERRDTCRVKDVGADLAIAIGEARTEIREAVEAGRSTESGSRNDNAGAGNLKDSTESDKLNGRMETGDSNGNGGSDDRNDNAEHGSSSEGTGFGDSEIEALFGSESGIGKDVIVGAMEKTNEGAAGTVPIFRVAQTMAMPDISAVEENKGEITEESDFGKKQKKDDNEQAKPIPLFRVAQTMAMPDINFIK